MLPTFFVWYHDVTGLPRLGVPQRLATVPCMGPCLLLLREATTKVVRPRSDQGSRYK